jgi:hypothetical protein
MVLMRRKPTHLNAAQTLAVIPAQAGIQRLNAGMELDRVLLLQHAVRAIRSANVRSGFLPPQSGLRRDDGSINGKAFS